MSGRIGRRFAALKAEGRSGFVAFVTAGDPDPETSAEILRGLPAAGADLIEMGMPFSDPMADGPAVQASSQRALKAGASLRSTIAQVKAFRAGDDGTPIILMGYFNPIYIYGVEAFMTDAKAAGVDGLIIVDLPPEEAHEVAPAARAVGLDRVPLATPTSDDERLARICDGAGGFVYYVSIAGVTGTRSPAMDAVATAVERIRRQSDLPVAVGFGIKTHEQAAAVARVADAAVVGSALVERVREKLDENGSAREDCAAHVLAGVTALATAIRDTGREGP